MKRPLLPVALFFVCGILAAELIPLPLPVVVGSLVCLAIAALNWSPSRLSFLYFLALLAGFTDSKLHTEILAPTDLRNILHNVPQLVVIRGVLLETPTVRVYDHDEQPAWRTMARLKTASMCLAKGNWQPVSGRVTVTTPGLLTNYFCGETVEITGVVDRPRLAIAEGTFDYRKYLEQKGIYYQVKAQSEDDWRVLGSAPALPLADRFSAWGRRALAIGLPFEDESLRLEWALALGWKTALTEEVAEPFVRAATYHIFAVDGLRMAIVFGIFYSVLRAFSLPRPLCGALLIPVIWFYVALTGWPASAIRASVMLTIIIAGWILKRPGDATNSLFAAALVILVWEPQQVFQAGFQLSFFVVLCLILTIPWMFEWVKKLTAPDPMLPVQLRAKLPPFLGVPARYAGDLVATSFAAWIGSLPLVAYYFNIVTPVSTPANVIAVPLCVLVLTSNLISLLLAAWFPGAAELFNHAGWFAMECIRSSSAWFAKWPFAYWYTSAPGLFGTCLYYAILLGLVTGWFIRPAFRVCKIASITVAILIWGWTFGHGLASTKLTILPVNGGTSIYADAAGSKKDLLIDVGPSNSVQFVIKPFLRAQGVNRLPGLLLTHGDVHHVGGAEPVVQTFDTTQIYSSPVRFRSVAYRRTLTHFENTPGLLRPVGRNSVVGNWTVVHPDADDRFTKADDGAVVLRGQLDGTIVLLLSDLGRIGQSAVLKRASDLRADIVVAGLPSSGEPLCDALIEAIHPRLIIISDSEFPVTERASPQLHARLNRTRIATIYTRDVGAATLVFRKGWWELRTMSGTAFTSADDLTFKARLLPEPNRQTSPTHQEPN